MRSASTDDDDVAHDAGEADRGPDAEQRAASSRTAGGPCWSECDSSVDHPAEQHGLEELQPGDDQVGAGEQPGDPHVAAEQGEDTRP